MMSIKIETLINGRDFPGHAEGFSDELGIFAAGAAVMEQQVIFSEEAHSV